MKKWLEKYRLNKNIKLQKEKNLLWELKILELKLINEYNYFNDNELKHSDLTDNINDEYFNNAIDKIEANIID